MSVALVYLPFTHEPACYKLLCNKFNNLGLVLRGTGCGIWRALTRPPRARPTVRPAVGSWAPWLGQARSVRYLTPLLNYHLYRVR